MKLSVALCTYNGARFLQEQLNSIANQSYPPDELVVCDDGSTDETIEILRRCSNSAPLTVKIYQNETTLGPTKNFERTISLCNGDIIALSDQDDVWMPQKLARLIQVFEEHPAVGYVFSDARVVDESLNPLGYSLWQAVYFTPREQACFSRGFAIDILLKHDVVTGATMAFRAYLRDFVLPIPEILAHDWWISLVGSILTKGIVIKEPLILYRRHPKQVTGAKSFFEQILEARTIRHENHIKNLQVEINRCSAVKKRLESILMNDKVKQTMLAQLNDKIDHLRTRAKMPTPQWQRFSYIAKEFLTGRYKRYSFGWKSAIKDFLIKMNLDEKL